ncbi:hypothetical protein QQF64_005846 [Cirrhinus molitorella]|uniref:Uncharacterized protein n=1 Tax=Cirrhinus molitorella TaxID=172907 RepID=A0ABR3MDG0_9TELE
MGENKPQPRHLGQKTKDWWPDNLATLPSTLIFSLSLPARHPTQVSQSDYTHTHTHTHTQTYLISTISMQGWSTVWLRCDLLQRSGMRRCEDICPAQSALRIHSSLSCELSLSMWRGL